ncbi:MAG: M23 family metallopeptidase [Candidatus Omnitrophica bacterium]|jgi:murein DD-endopeptidase MepM/ murein hydrolase activator NlpD|nr:M23 family metallopeptidase [Candidatus Omnitrophota bacterium]MDD5660562.1 M23 family metallopeptidase [Candidatus Omnitrophota bacterium]
MKKFFLVVLIILTTYVFLGIASIDKRYFVCPIEYKNDIIVRNDAGGNGVFAATRSGGRRLHKGIDLLADVGTPVLAAKSGKIISAAQNFGMGKYVIVQHKNDVITVYGHLSEILVRKNDYVGQGQVIGKVGRTGNARYRSILSHLHFEVRKNGIPQDPLEYI